VEREEFEEAAKVRDEIKYYEKQLFNREDGE
jgi:protein-arginine kinase activator protein McsA